MKDFDARERLIVRDLLKSEAGLNAYTFWRRYHLSPELLAKALRRLLKDGIVSFDGSHIGLTNKGHAVAIRSRDSIFPVRAKPWRECPVEFKQFQLPIEEPIVPRISMLDDSLLPENFKPHRKQS